MLRGKRSGPALSRQIDDGRVRLERLRLRLQDLEDAEAALLRDDTETEALAEAEMQQEQAAEAVERTREDLEQAEGGTGKTPGMP